MSTAKMTTAEARRLIEMAKRELIAEIGFPSKGAKELDAVGDTKGDVFTVNIFRGKFSELNIFLALASRKMALC